MIPEFTNEPKKTIFRPSYQRRVSQSFPSFTYPLVSLHVYHLYWIRYWEGRGVEFGGFYTRGGSQTLTLSYTTVWGNPFSYLNFKLTPFDIPDWIQVALCSEHEIVGCPQ